MKDTWKKPKGDRMEGGRWGWVGWGGVVRGKWRQLYFNNNKKEEILIVLCSKEFFLV